MSKEAPGGGAGVLGMLKYICCPFYLLGQSILIYVLPCIEVMMGRICCAFWCFVCMPFRSCLMYKDSSFPPDNRSLGSWNKKTKEQLDQEVEWHRAADIFPDSRNLVSDKVEPADVAQGQLGDCWLLSAIACLAEHPGSLRGLFQTLEYNPRGKYKINLYDKLNECWQTITLDDYFPCSKADKKPIFAQAQDKELWVLLLEKAFAKMYGGYDTLQGGLILTALEAMTGDEVMSYKKVDNKFQRFNLVHFEPEPNSKKPLLGLAKTEEFLDNDHMFDVIKTYDSQDASIGAGSEGDDDTKQMSGIVAGHAYSIIRVVESGGFKLVRLRNPWGSFEWDGAWSDNSVEWKKNSSVASTCGMKVEDAHGNDGAFWMEWSDFLRFFKVIHVVDRSTGFKDLQLDVREQDGCCGVCQGCLAGCCSFWCLCQGTKALCCAHESSSRTVKTSSCAIM